MNSLILHVLFPGIGGNCEYRTPWCTNVFVKLGLDKSFGGKGTVLHRNGTKKLVRVTTLVAMTPHFLHCRTSSRLRS